MPHLKTSIISIIINGRKTEEDVNSALNEVAAILGSVGMLTLQTPPCDKEDDVSIGISLTMTLTSDLLVALAKENHN